MNILGLKILRHDPGAALISGDRVVAISEERLNRIKHSTEVFPSLAIDYCLNTLSLSDKDIDLIVIDLVGREGQERVREIFHEKTNGRFVGKEICFINHQDAHAASAFYASPFSEAAVLVYDGAGQRHKLHLGVYATESESLYYATDKDGMTLLQKSAHLRRGSQFPYTSGIGKLYTHFSDFYLGFGPFNEGKMMGLAPYGNNSFLKQYPFERWFTERQGAIVCNSNIIAPKSTLTLAPLGKNTVARIRRRTRSVVNRFISRAFFKLNSDIYVDAHVFEPIRLNKPPRTKNIELPDQYYTNIAYALQKVLEEVAYLWGIKLKKITRSENLCVAGGVGLNIDANRNFLDRVGFKEIFIQPAASDTGIPLGCALWGAHVVKKLPRSYRMNHAYLGREYTEQDILAALQKEREHIEMVKSADIATDTARLIAQGKIIGWFQGASEYGPRALGHRSILCDARHPDMKDILNNRVKHRESWRPFATSILKERCTDYFDLAYESPFMLLTGNLRADKKGSLPSVTHADNTSRIQTVTKEDNGIYYDLISAFYKETGTPLLLNTSFNLGGEPIVETPWDALHTFLRTDMDYLVLGDYLVRKITT